MISSPSCHRSLSSLLFVFVVVVATVMWWCRFCLNSFSSHWWVDFGMGFVNGGGGGLLGSCLWLKFCGFFVFFFFFSVVVVVAGNVGIF